MASWVPPAACGAGLFGGLGAVFGLPAGGIGGLEARAERFDALIGRDFAFFDPWSAVFGRF